MRAGIDANLPDSPAILAVGPLAAWLHVAATCWSRRLMTDGLIPEDVERLLVFPQPVDNSGCNPVDKSVDNSNASRRYFPRLSRRDSDYLAASLVAVGLWSKVPTGYRLEDFTENNPSQDRLKTAREKGAARQAAKRARDTLAATQSHAFTSTLARADALVVVTPVLTPVPETLGPETVEAGLPAYAGKGVQGGTSESNGVTHGVTVRSKAAKVQYSEEEKATIDRICEILTPYRINQPGPHWWRDVLDRYGSLDLVEQAYGMADYMSRHQKRRVTTMFILNWLRRIAPQETVQSPYQPPEEGDDPWERYRADLPGLGIAPVNADRAEAAWSEVRSAAERDWRQVSHTGDVGVAASTLRGSVGLALPDDGGPIVVGIRETWGLDELSDHRPLGQLVRKLVAKAGDGIGVEFVHVPSLKFRSV